jgi:hypothetical protein
MIGGPQDGRERHLIGSLKEQEVLYEAGDWSKGSREVHVYRSLGGRAPFRYEGMRPWIPDVDVVNCKTR